MFLRKFYRKESKIRYVQVVVEFTRIGEIDTLNEKYTAEFHIESKWIESQVIDDYDLKVHWNPRLYIENAFQDLKEVINYEVRPLNDETTIILEKRLVKGVFWERLELQNFPFDIQELSITVCSKLTKDEIKLVSDPEEMSFVNLSASHTFIDQQKWNLFEMVKISEYASYDIGSSSNKINRYSMQISKFDDTLVETPKIVATIYCSRRAGYYMFNAFFLIFLITVSSLCVFSIDCKLPQSRLQTTFTLLLTSISFKWVVNRSLPTVSYLTSLDTYAIVCIVYLCSLCIWHAIAGSFWIREVAKLNDKYAFIVYLLVLLILHICVGIWFIIAYHKILKLYEQETKYLNTVGKDKLKRMRKSVNKAYELHKITEQK